MKDELAPIDLAQVVKRYWLVLLILPTATILIWFLQSQQTQTVFSAAVSLQSPPMVADAVGDAVRRTATGVKLQGPNNAIVISAESVSPEQATETVANAYPAILAAASSAVDAEIARTQTILSVLDRELTVPSGEVSSLLLAFDRAPGFRDRISILEEWKSDAAAMLPSVSIVERPMSLAWAGALWAIALFITLALLTLLHTSRRQPATLVR